MKNKFIGYFNYTVYPTYVGMASGVAGIVFALHEKPQIAIIFLMLSGLFDMFDGTIARTRKRTSEEKRFGIQIDSLADLVCFGILPIIIGYSLGMESIWYLIIMIVYVLCALARLAYFNVSEEERQNETNEVRKFYEGLPVTSVAAIFPLIRVISILINNDKYATVIYAVSLVVLSFLFVAKIKIPKPHGKSLILLGLFGIIEFVAFLALSFNLL